MVKASPIKTSFNAGEWSPLMGGHINLEKFPDSCLTMQNMIALKQGPAVRRGGTKFIKEVKNSAHNTVLLPFNYNATTSYQIEAGNLYFRFYKNDGVITLSSQAITNITQANPAVLTYSGADTYANGDEVYISGVVGMTQVNGKFFRVANVNAGANTFELQTTDSVNVNSTGYTAYSSGGTIAEVYEVVSPYAHTDLLDSNYIKKFQTAQSADVIYIAHGSYNTRSLARTSDTSWTVNSMVLNDGPYMEINATATTISLSGTSGSVTVTASSTTGINSNTGFQTTDVGRIIRWKDPANNWTWLTITAYTSTTVVTATISGPNASAGTATASWRLGAYSDTTGWPRVIGFFQSRMVLASSTSEPDRIDFSRTGGFSDTTLYFAPSDANGTVTDDAAIVIDSLPSGNVNNIDWVVSDSRGLLVGSAGSEFLVRASLNNETLTPTNKKVDKITTFGSAYIQPVQAESSAVFIQAARRKVYDVIYSLEQDQLKPRDLSIFAEHMTRGGIAELALQQEPINVIWGRMTDGGMFGVTYYPDHSVFAFHSHVIGGTGVKVRSLSVIPSTDGSKHELYMIVSRTINGTTRQYIEEMTQYYEDTTLKRDAICTDSALVYDSPLTITGATKANPVVVTVASHGLSTGDYVDIEDVGGMTELNGNRYKITVLTGNTFSLQNQYTSVDINGTAYTTYTSGGEARKAVTTVTGLDHLNGETVKVMVNGTSQPDVTVSSGSITLANSRRGSVIIAGLSNTWKLKTQRMEAGAKDGTAQGKTKRITRFVVRLLNSLGMKYGLNEDETLEEYDFNQGASYNEDLALFSGDTESILFPHGYETSGTLYFEGNSVFPITFLAIMPQVDTQDR